MKTNKLWLYLDDQRSPKEKKWQVVKNYDEFVSHINLNGLERYELISLDHDLGDSSINEYYNNVLPNYTLDYSNIVEKTGMDCARFLISYYYSKFSKEVARTKPEKMAGGITFPKIYTHSANPIGSANIMGYVNNFYKNERQPQTCIRVEIDHTRIDQKPSNILK